MREKNKIKHILKLCVSWAVSKCPYKIAKSDYRMWFYLNNKSKISVLTPLGETDHATIMNGIGQGSFAAALASSLNIGCGVERITRVIR